MARTKSPSPAHRDTLLAAALNISEDDARALRLCSRRLSRWAERECGWDTPGASHCYRVDDDGAAYHDSYPHRGAAYSRPIRNDEAAALKRIMHICGRLGLHYYHQGDPRGAALYVARVPMDGHTYTRDGRAVY